ncbi:MAG: FAD-dependent oxidoreductase, partial [Micrococcaceae bacterium]
MSKKFNIVGGGIAGLVSAWELSRAGHDVTVYERRSLGGVVSSHELMGINFDAGAESFATRTTAVKDLLQELGLTQKIIKPLAKPSWVYSDQYSYPNVPGVFGIPAGLDDVAAALSASGIEQLKQDITMGADVGTTEAMSLGDLVELRMGKEVVDKLVAPVVTGVQAASPYDLDANSVIPGIQQQIQKSGSLQQAVATLRKAAPAGQQVLSLTGGMFQLSDELVKQCMAQGVSFVHEEVTSLTGLENPIVATEMADAQLLLQSIVDIKEQG